MAMSGAGQLKERLAFDMREMVDDGYGNEVGQFLEQFQRRAGFTILRGSEAVLSARLEGRQPIVARLRADSQTRSITTDWQVRDLRTGKIYAVRSSAETPDRKYVDVMIESGVAA